MKYLQRKPAYSNVHGDNLGGNDCETSRLGEGRRVKLTKSLLLLCRPQAPLEVGSVSEPWQAKVCSHAN